jgi:hypothetical protein
VGRETTAGSRDGSALKRSSAARFRVLDRARSARKSGIVCFRRLRLRKVDEPTAVLWRDLKWWFRDASHPGPDLDFCGLAPNEVESAWQYVAKRADPLDPSATASDDVEGREVSAASLLANGAVYAASRSPGLLVGVRNIDVAGQRLPWLGVRLSRMNLASTDGSTIVSGGRRRPRPWRFSSMICAASFRQPTSPSKAAATTSSGRPSRRTLLLVPPIDVVHRTVIGVS